MKDDDYKTLLIEEKKVQDNEFINNYILRRGLKLTIHKLRSPSNEQDVVWDLSEWLEFNKDKAAGIFKLLPRQRA